MNKASKQTVEPLSTQNAIFTKDHVEIVSELFAWSSTNWWFFDSINYKSSHYIFHTTFNNPWGSKLEMIDNKVMSDCC